MRTQLIILLFSLLPVFSFSNANQLQSLATSAYELRNTDPSLSLKIASILHQEAERLNIPYYQAYSLNLHGLIAGRELKLKEAMRCFDQALALQPPIGLKLTLLKNKANLFGWAGMTDEAFYWLEKAEDIALKSNSNYLLSILDLKAALLARSGNAEQASYLIQSLITDASPSEKLKLLIGLSSCQFECKKWKQTLYTLQVAESLAKKHPLQHQWLKANYLRNKGISLYHSGQATHARAILEEAASHCREFQYDQLLIPVITTLQQINYETNNFDAYAHNGQELKELTERRFQEVQAINNYQAQVDKEQLAQQNTYLEAARQKQKTLIYFCIVSSSMLISMLFLWFFNWAGKQKALKKLRRTQLQNELLKELQEVELNEQKAYIHFLEAEKTKIHKNSLKGR